MGCGWAGQAESRRGQAAGPVRPYRISREPKRALRRAGAAPGGVLQLRISWADGNGPGGHLRSGGAAGAEPCISPALLLLLYLVADRRRPYLL